jgi:hypothetical protein
VEFVTVRLRVPGTAVEETDTPTLRCEESTTVTDVVATSPPENPTLIPLAKLLPVTVIVPVAPGPNALGESDATVGPRSTVKQAEQVSLLVSGLVTVTSRLPTLAFPATTT